MLFGYGFIFIYLCSEFFIWKCGYYTWYLEGMQGGPPFWYIKIEIPVDK